MYLFIHYDLYEKRKINQKFKENSFIERDILQMYRFRYRAR